MAIGDGITRKDLDIAILVSVVVTAVVIVTLVLIIYGCGDRRWCHPEGTRYSYIILSSCNSSSYYNIRSHHLQMWR